MSKLVQGGTYEESSGAQGPVQSMEDFMNMNVGTARPASPVVPMPEEPVAYTSNTAPVQEQEQRKPVETREDAGGDKPKARASDIVKNKDMKKLVVVVGAIVVLVVGVIAIKGLFSGGKDKSKEGDDGYVPSWMDDDDDYVSSGFSYTASEVSKLRQNGYTGTEIEAYEQAETPASVLIEQATQARQELYEKEIAPYLDSASDEYKELAANTWVGQDELTFSSDTKSYSRYTDVMNVDYEKIPAHGMQLYIKLITAKGNVLFMNVTPEQYVKLDDEGNIVVKLEYTKTGDGATIVTAITEVSLIK